MKTVAEQKKQNKKLANMTGERINNAPPLPKDLSSFDDPEMIQLFKMMSLIESGTMQNWEVVRQAYIQNKNSKPSEKNMKNLQASLLSQIKSKNLSQEDVLMNEMNVDTNDIISKIQDGTVDVDSGEKELQKMKMVEGDMPGQGKQKQGNWRG
tara:strand:+ start:7441 stop:7899 length:459 start_codon:yes stop_codon:yes gene_type:complete